jgi:branched-subunit amino acid transport protein
VAPVTTAWVVVALVGVATMATKAAGPVLLGGRDLPPFLTGVIGLLAPALLAALVVTLVFTQGERLVVDERLIGVAAAGVAIWLRAPLLLSVVVAAVATAIARAVS